MVTDCQLANSSRETAEMDVPITPTPCQQRLKIQSVSLFIPGKSVVLMLYFAIYADKIAGNLKPTPKV
jgi:hypothetical protein